MRLSECELTATSYDLALRIYPAANSSLLISRARLTINRKFMCKHVTC